MDFSRGVGNPASGAARGGLVVSAYDSTKHSTVKSFASRGGEKNHVWIINRVLKKCFYILSTALRLGFTSLRAGQ